MGIRAEPAERQLQRTRHFDRVGVRKLGKDSFTLTGTGGGLVRTATASVQITK